MIHFAPINSDENRENLKRTFNQQAPYPIDSFWNEVIVGGVPFYEIQFEKKVIGHVGVEDERRIVRFQLDEHGWRYANEVLVQAKNDLGIREALVATFESQFLAIALEHHKSIATHSFLWSDFEDVPLNEPEPGGIEFRPANPSDLDNLVNHFPVPFDGYYEGTIDRGQLFVLYSGQAIWGVGERRQNTTQSNYGEVGVLVIPEKRRQGIATYILGRLKQVCYREGLQPIALCDFENVGSQKMLRKAGFETCQRIVAIEFNI